MKRSKAVFGNSAHRNGWRKGMALVEYALIGISVLLVCIAAFLVVGGNLNSWMAGLNQQAKQQVDNTNTQKVAIAAAKAADEAARAKAAQANIANVATQALSSSGSDSLCSSSWCISAPGLTGATVSTAGSNGNQMVQLTESASNVYAQLAKILEAQGADPGIISLLTNMANQGHAMGNAQSVLLSKSGDYNTMKSNMTTLSGGLNDFKQMNQQLRSLLPQLPADTRGILQDASNVIIGVGDSYSLNNGSGEIGWSYTSKNISLTHSNSNTICQNGGNTSVCVQ